MHGSMRGGWKHGLIARNGLYVGNPTRGASSGWCASPLLYPALQLKMGYRCLGDDQLAALTEVACTVSELANLSPFPRQPYVGRSAFAHKGGVHVDALVKCEASYQHIDPSLVGNNSRVVVSELAGRSNVAYKLRELGLDDSGDADARRVLERIKTLESFGFQFEGAEGSLELLVRRSRPGYRPPFELLNFHVLVRDGHLQAEPEDNGWGTMAAEATVKLRVGTETIHTAADGNGPVNALDTAVRKALLPFYPALDDVHLTDYKVRILDGEAGTSALTRVLIDSSDGERAWSTVGSSPNIIEASWQALADSLEYALLRPAGERADQAGSLSSLSETAGSEP